VATDELTAAAAAVELPLADVGAGRAVAVAAAAVAFVSSTRTLLGALAVAQKLLAARNLLRHATATALALNDLQTLIARSIMAAPGTPMDLTIHQFVAGVVAAHFRRSRGVAAVDPNRGLTAGAAPLHRAGRAEPRGVAETVARMHPAVLQSAADFLAAELSDVRARQELFLLPAKTPSNQLGFATPTFALMTLLRAMMLIT